MEYGIFTFTYTNPHTTTGVATTTTTSLPELQLPDVVVAAEDHPSSYEAS